MPHATNIPSSGFQAIILCGPGVSLNTFTANPDEFPKALVPIANRPMVWYPLDWCYRMGIINIQLITPPSSAKAIEAALSQNPHLTSLPSPKADILAPAGLSHTTPTAEILRLPEVQTAITGDFLVLPCDLVCELPGESLLETWMISQGGLGGASHTTAEYLGPKMGPGGESGGRRGGLGVWYETKGEDSVKGAETDFIITTAASPHAAPPAEGSLRPHVSKLLYATTTDTLRDITEEKKGFPIRHGLIRKHGKIRMLTTHRDAHIYLFPHWVVDMISHNGRFDSISEDVVGWWAKAGWQDGLAEKLHLSGIFNPSPSTDATKDTESSPHSRTAIESSIDLFSLSSTNTSAHNNNNNNTHSFKTPSNSLPPTPTPSSLSSNQIHPPPSTSSIPPILAYIHPSSHPSPTPFPLIRRVDTPALLLSTSLHIASLPPTHPLSHPPTIPTPHYPQTSIQHPTTLIGPNTTINIHVSIKNTVIGANCAIGPGAKISGSLLMDGVTVGEGVVLQGCILGRRCVVGAKASLRECEIQEGFRVDDAVEAKGEKFSVFEGLEGGEEEGIKDDDGEDREGSRETGGEK